MEQIPQIPLSDEELQLSEEATKVGGGQKLPRDKFIRLIALRYVRLDGFSLEDATRCATLQRDVQDAGGIYKVSKDVREELKKFYSRSRKLESDR